jgi:hypothetical protein
LSVERELPLALKLRLTTTVSVSEEVEIPTPANALETTWVNPVEAEELPLAVAERVSP